MSTLITFDPSVNCTGFAVFDGEDLRECGRIKTRSHFQKNRIRHKIPAHKRIDQAVDEIRQLIGDYPDAVFGVEITSGKQSKRIKYNQQGLGTYGMLVGQVVRLLIESRGPELVHQVYENDWTRGKSKEIRQETCAYRYPFYKEHWYEKDKVTKNKSGAKFGGDVSDAIMIGEYILMNQILHPATDHTQA